MDIKDLLRTYVFPNDPNVEEITTQFGMILGGLGLATAAVWGSVVLAGDGDVPSPHAAEAEDEHPDAELGDEVQDCVPEHEAYEWKQDHDDVLMSNRLLDVEETGGWVCYTYVK